MDIASRATTLLELHHTGSPLVLPNVWDAWSARVVAGAGFTALSIGSHPLADGTLIQPHVSESVDRA